MPKNLVYDLQPYEIQEVAEKVRESNLVWDAVEAWVKRRLEGIHPEQALRELGQILENEADYYVNAWLHEQSEQDEDDHADEHEVNPGAA